MRWLVVVVLVVCGCETDLTGIYRVDTQVGSAPCGADQPLVGRPPFLKFYKEKFVFQEYFAYDGCMDAAATTCTPIGGLFSGFQEQISDGWRGLESTASSSGTMCTFSYDEQTAVLKDKALVIELHEYSQTVDLPSAQCTAKEATNRGASMPCAIHEHIAATKL
jgi:hypothetical protein